MVGAIVPFLSLTEASERVVRLGERLINRAVEMREARRGLPQGEQSDLASKSPDDLVAELEVLLTTARAYADRERSLEDPPGARPPSPRARANR